MVKCGSVDKWTRAHTHTQTERERTVLSIYTLLISILSKCFMWCEKLRIFSFEFSHVVFVYQWSCLCAVTDITGNKPTRERPVEAAWWWWKEITVGTLVWFTVRLGVSLPYALAMSAGKCFPVQAMHMHVSHMCTACSSGDISLCVKNMHVCEPRVPVTRRGKPFPVWQGQDWGVGDP